MTGCGGTAGSACPGDIFYVGYVGSTTGVNSSRSSFPYKNEWSPRLGAAYQLNPKTVIRGGYGIFYSPNYVSFAVNPYIDPTVSATSSFFASNNGGLSPASTLDSSGCVLLGAGGVTNTFTCTQTGPFGTNLVAPVGGTPHRISRHSELRRPMTNMLGEIMSLPTLSSGTSICRESCLGDFLDVAYAGRMVSICSNSGPASIKFPTVSSAKLHRSTIRPRGPVQRVTICQKVGL